MISTSLHDLINVYSRRSGADNARGQNFDVNRNLLSLHSFARSLKNSVWILILYIFFHAFIHVYRPGAGAHNPLGRNFDVNRNILSLQKISFISDIIQFFHHFIHIYSLGAGTGPQGTKFWCPLQSFVASLKKMSLKSDLYKFFTIYYMHIAPG